MNIFIMVLVILFMAGYYFLDSPSQRIARHELDNAITQTDLRSVAECAAAAHTAVIKDYEFDNDCVQQFEITSTIICLDARMSATKCEIVRNKKPAASFIITSTAPLLTEYHNKMIEILEKYYSNAGNFGILTDDVIMSGAVTAKKPIPKGIIKAAELSDGELVYMTQYEIPDTEIDYIASSGPGINCGAGTTKVYRFGKWQCMPRNEKISCSGDMIWDTELGECIPDDSRRPLCAARQTAVMVDDVWECVDPFLEKKCPAGMTPRLNYINLEWECVEDPRNTKNTKKCAPAQSAVYGSIGSTLRVPATSCTDCEELITNPDTCETACVPDPTRLGDKRCYPSSDTCTGSHKAFYFGFPSVAYAAKVSIISGYNVPLDASHSQNRKFNCMDCGEGQIDTELSLPPYIAVCK